MIKLFITTLTAFILFLSSCRSDNSGVSNADNYLYTDPKPDKVYPAKIIELEFNSSGSKIFGFEYVANGGTLHPTVILLHANPGNERNLDVAQALRRAGYNVVFFNYRGSWGSQGTFSYANSIADTKNVIDYVCNPENVQNMRIDTANIFLIGHNLGAGIGLIEGLNDPRVKAVAAISLFNPYTIFRGREAVLNFSDIKEYLTTLKMLNCDPQQYLMDIVENVNSYNIEQMIARANKPVLVMDEHRNNAYLSRFNKKKKGFNYEVWETDIEFSNHRIALTKKLKNWLDSSVSRPAKK